MAKKTFDYRIGRGQGVVIQSTRYSNSCLKTTKENYYGRAFSWTVAAGSVQFRPLKLAILCGSNVADQPVYGALCANWNHIRRERANYVPIAGSTRTRASGRRKRRWSAAVRPW